MADSMELNVIEEECTEPAGPTDKKQGVTTEQNVEENIEGIIDKNSGKRKIDSKALLPEGNVAPKLISINKRKKSPSEVEFCVKSNVAQDEVKSSTDSLNKISNVGRRSPAQARRTRQSFSGMGN
jgi:hypothetical protein